MTRVSRVHAVDARMGALDDDVGFDLGRPQSGGGVGGEERVAGSGGKDDDTALLEVPNRPAADVGLGDAGHLDRRLHTGVLPEPFERVLERQCVHDRAEHADVIRLGGIHAAQGPGTTSPEVPATHHHGNVDAQILAQIDDVASGRFERRPVEPLARFAGECLARGLEHDPLPTGPRPSSGMDRLVTHRGATVLEQATTGRKRSTVHARELLRDAAADVRENGVIEGQPISTWAKLTMEAPPMNWLTDCLSSFAYG